MKKTLGILLLFLGMLFVGETTVARTQTIDTDVQIEQGVSLSADEMQSIRGGETIPLKLCADFAVLCIGVSWSFWGGLVCAALFYLCVTY